MGRKRIVAVALLGALALGLARSGGPLHADPIHQETGATTLNGALAALTPASDVLVRVRANVPLVVTLRGETFDAYLTLYDSVGQVVAENDDHAPLFNLPARTDAGLSFTPRTDDLMLVRAASLGWAGTGAFSMTVQGAVVLSQNPFSIVQDAPGAVIDGELIHFPGREPRLAYAFPARAGDTLTFTLSSAAFDAVLDVYDADSAFLIGNDDHNPVYDLPNGTDAALQFGVPADGRYVVLVRSYGGEDVGRFTLTLGGAAFEEEAAAAQAAVTPTPSAPTVLPGAVTCAPALGGVVRVSSAFDATFRADNLIDANLGTGWSSQAGDSAPSLIFEVSSGSPVRLDSLVFDGFSASPGFEADSVRGFTVGVSASLVAPEEFQTVLEAEAPQDNRLVVYPIEPVEARYVLLRPLSNYGGRFFQATEFNVCAAAGSPAAAVNGTAPPFVISGRLPPDIPYREYRVYALEGARMTVTLTSTQFDPVVEVYAADGRKLGDNDDHPPDIELPGLSDAGLRLDFPAAETVLIQVRSFALGGDFVLRIDGANLQLTPPRVPSLPPCRDVSSAAVGGSIVRFSSEFTGRWLADYLIDGYNETGWASAPGEVSAREEYVIIDLVGEGQTIQGLRINPSATGGDSTAYNTSRFAVLVSDTDPRLDSFHEVFSTLLSERYAYTLAFDLPQPVQARYVMLQTRDSFGGRWHEVAEFTVCAATS